MVFNDYAKCYNLLYKDKDYVSEATYIDKLIKEYGKNRVENVLDIGCGTGTQARHMSKLGYMLTGIDLSQEMINLAIAKRIPNADFYMGNASNFIFNKKFDVITSLFHVLSYQTTNEGLEAMIRNTSEHLNEGGLFIFDFWYGPAVLTEKPSVKVKRLEDEEMKVTRIAEPVMKVNENVVDVNFELLIYDKLNKKSELVREVHPMRYFFKPEIEMLLTLANLRSVHFREWMTGQTPSDTTWGVCCVAMKIKCNENESSYSLL